MAITSGGVSIPVGADLSGFEKGLKTAEKLANKTASGIKKFALGKIWDTSSFVSGMKMSNKELDSFRSKMEQAKDDYKAMLDLSKGLHKSGLWSGLGDGEKNAVSQSIDIAKTKAEAYERTMKHLSRGQFTKKIFGGVKKAFTGIGSVFAGFRQRTAQAGNDFRNFLRRIIGIGAAVYVVRKAFQMMRDGLNNLIQADSRTAASVNQLKGALASLRNALGAIAAPIINAVAPVLVKIINLFTRAANAVAHFMAAITGQKSVVIATEGVSDGVSGIGDAASGANDKAKELQRTLMGFDKINKLDGNNDSGSGGSGGGGGGGAGSGFTTVPISGFAEDWAEKFKKSWEDADFYWLGELLGTKLRDALDRIPWDTIQTVGAKIGKSIATGLNGFFETEDLGYTIGKTIAEAGNTILITADSFAVEFHWDSFGKFIGDEINGFFKNFNFKLLGKTFSDFAIGILTSISSALETVDWQQVARSVEDLLIGVNWSGILTALAKVLGAALGGLAKVIGTLIGDAFDSARDYFAQHIENCGGNIVSGLYEGIVRAIGGIFNWIKTNIFDPFIKGFKNAFGISSPSTVMEEQGGYIIAGLLEGLKNKISDVFTWFKELPGRIKDSIGKIDLDIGGKMSGALDFVANLTGWEKGKGFVDNISGMIAGFTGKVYSAGVDTISGWISKFTGKKYEGGADTISGWVAKFTKKVVDVSAGTLSGFTAKITKVTKKLSAKMKNLGSGFTATISKLKTAGKKLSGLLGIKDGGVFNGGRWSPIQRYASGGLPNGSQLFWAREAGPELVGTLGGRTAVMNNDQIVSSVSSGVAKAISGIRFKINATPKLANVGTPSQQNTQPPVVNDNTEVVNLLRVLIDEIRKKDFSVSLDGRQIGNTAINYINDETRRTGMTPIMI